MSGKVVLCIVVSAGISALRCGAAVYQSDGSAASVQGLHNAALNGDTITLPAGTFTWSTQVHLTKNITIQGAGQGVTIIYDNVTKTSGSSSIMLFCTGVTGDFRVTGFTIRGQAQDTNNYNKGTIVVGGTSHSVRIDHITFDRPGTGAMQINGNIWGVVDHCYFNEPNSKNGVHVQHDQWGGAANFGDGSFEDQVHLGSGEGVYIEDCTFVGDGTGGTTAVNGYAGARVVFRHNRLIMQNTGGHGTEGDRGRSFRSYEIYNNSFSSPTALMNTAIQLRGGTGVIWGNTISGDGAATGYRNAISCNNFRSLNQYNNTNFGWASGSNPWDENIDPVGHACLDQVGRGLCLDQIRGSSPINQRTRTAAWPRQQAEPFYVWSNNWTPVPRNPGDYIVANQATIRIGQDIIDNGNAPKPGYTPFVYPHPLVTSDPFPTPTPTPPPPPSATQCSLLQQRLDRLQRRQERLERRNRSNPRLKRRIRRLERQLQLQHCP
jgi:hypothetical protein